MTSNCKVTLTIARSGPRNIDQRAGDVIEVSLLEAARMLRAGQIERPDAKTLKAIAAAETADATETAAPQG